MNDVFACVRLCVCVKYVQVIKFARACNCRVWSLYFKIPVKINICLCFCEGLCQLYVMKNFVNRDEMLFRRSLNKNTRTPPLRLYCVFKNNLTDKTVRLNYLQLISALIHNCFLIYRSSLMRQKKPQQTTSVIDMAIAQTF